MATNPYTSGYSMGGHDPNVSYGPTSPYSSNQPQTSWVNGNYNLPMESTYQPVRPGAFGNIVGGGGNSYGTGMVNMPQVQNWIDAGLQPLAPANSMPAPSWYSGPTYYGANGNPYAYQGDVNAGLYANQQQQAQNYNTQFQGLQSQQQAQQQQLASYLSKMVSMQQALQKLQSIQFQPAGPSLPYINLQPSMQTQTYQGLLGPIGR